MSVINATQFVGIVAFGIAAVVSTLAWRAARDARRHWALIVIVNTLLAAECGMGVRHRLHAFATDWLMARNLYGARHMPQEYLIAVAAAVGLILALAIVVRARRRSVECLATWLATILSLVLFAIETVSLHSIDAVFYRPVGSVALIGWLWLILGSATALSARAELRHNKP